jgi:hypothetical protein|tara:strand:- start:18125 stop:18346 length:222 start_codon:yes stop_codon:yes gene_type:complete
MVFGKLTEVFGHQGIRLLWKVYLLYVAFTLFEFFEFTKNFLDSEIGGLPLFTGRNILAALALILFWMIHKNQL